MRIFINAASAHMGGAVTYLQNILRWLPVVASDWEFDVYVPEATVRQLEDRDGIARSVRLNAFPYAGTAGAARFYFDQVQVPILLKRTGAEVLFSCTGFGTYFSPCPQVLLIRNPVYFDPLFHATYKKMKRSLRSNAFSRWLSITSARTSDVVLFPTRAMQSAVEQYVSLNDKMTAAIHYGFDEETFYDHREDSPSSFRNVDGWKANGDFVVLNVSTYAVHKNYETVVEALRLLKERGLKIRFLTTISRDRTSDKTEYDALRQRVVHLGLESEFIELGYVPYRELGALYRKADAYLFPSFTESFGHTMVEAMSAGLPIVAASTPVNKEVCGRAGRFFQTLNPVSCADVLQDVLLSESLRGEMARNSEERVKHFSWREYALELVCVLAAAADGASPARNVAEVNHVRTIGADSIIPLSMER